MLSSQIVFQAGNVWSLLDSTNLQEHYYRTYLIEMVIVYKENQFLILSFLLH